jgi:hypothetical protein
MHKIITKIYIVFLLALVLSSYTLANNSGFEIIKQSNSSIQLRYISGYTGDSVTSKSNKNTYLLPKFENVTTEKDRDNIYPQFYSKINLIVPSPDAFKIHVKSITTTNKENYEIETNPNAITSEELQPASQYFKHIRTLQNPPCKIEYKGIARNQHIAELVVSPVNFNPFTNKIMIYDTIYINIEFDISNVSYSSSPNNFNSISALNYDFAKNWIAGNKSSKSDEPKFQSQERTIASLSNGQWAKIVIEEEGVYRLDASDLQSVGIPSTPAAAKTLKIFGEGGNSLSEKVSEGAKNQLDEQEIIVKTKSDGSIESVIFYAAGTTGFEKRGSEIRHYKNFYSDKNNYLITWGGIDGKRAVALPNPTGEILNKPSTYTARVFFDEDVVNPFTPGAGRDWFGRSFFSSPLPPVMLHDLDRTGTISYRIALAQKAESNGVFTIYENNNQIGSLTLPYIRSYVSAERNFANIKIPASQIASDNRSILKFQFQNPQISAVGYFDYYELSYPRSFFAINNSINFITDKELSGLTEFSINGFNGEIYGYDISDLKNPKLLTNKSVTGGIFAFDNNINSSNLNRFYISANIRKPKLETVEIIGLRDKIDNAPVVVITHPDLYQSALKFKEYREKAMGVKVEVYRTDHIYNEYASGIPDITAIRDFLIDSYTRWTVKPEYLVLWGDGHYDYKNLATKKPNYLPAYQTFSYDMTSFDEIHEAYATDDFLALIDGDDLVVDLNFGRVTIDSPELGFWMVDKIKHYETASSEDIWRTNIIFVADDGPTEDTSYDGTRHTGQTENLQKNYISKNNPDLQFDKIYLVEYPVSYIGSGRRKPGVTEDMITRINTTGGVVLNWIGHGNPRVWSHEQILDRDVTIPRMRNLDKLFFLTAATCDFGRFDDPEVRSGAEDIFLSRAGGAIGVFSATRIVFSDDNARLTYAFFTRLMTRDPATGKFPTLGKTINAIKQTFKGTNDRKYFLIGDPTMSLLVPDYQIKVTKINDTVLNENNKNIELKALSKVKVSGEILNPATKTIDENYNGTIVVTLRDGDLNINIREMFLNTARDMFSFTKLGGSLNRSSYNVVNGRFDAEFIIPKDISFSDSISRMFLYSASNDGKYGSGSYHNLKIGGFEDSQIMDTIPPEIQIYVDGRKFKTGDFVTSNPRLIVDLFDESGINTTGLGIGHKIEGWIDDAPVSSDLTDKFTSSLSDSRRGTVEDILFGLAPGEHKIRVRAWDVFNNFSLSEVKFVIPEGKDGSLISDLYNYPNPFKEGSNLVFRHNANPPFDVNVEIYTINGVLIRNIQQTLSTLHTSQLFWDGLDNSGNNIPDGIYLYTVKLKHDNGLSLGRGKLVKIRN